MKRAMLYFFCLLPLMGCAHVEVPRKDIYPFRAEFVAQGSFQGKEMDVTGAIYLASAESGVIQTYLPGGMASYTIDIHPDALVIKDIWGMELDRVALPIKGVTGLVAGDMPLQRYLYKEETPGEIKVTYTWGMLWIDHAFLPAKVRVPGEPALDLLFKPSDGNVTMEVNYGKDVIRVLFMIRQGGRWKAS